MLVLAVFRYPLVMKFDPMGIAWIFFVWFESRPVVVAARLGELNLAQFATSVG